MKDTQHRTTIGGVGSFIPDLRDVFERYSKRTSVPHKRTVLFLILGGALLRGWMLFEPITYDEARAFDLFIGRNAGTILSDLTDPLNHVFHSLLAWISVSFFGFNKVALRLPAFVAAVLALPLFYLYTRAMFNRYIALLVLALVASSAPLIEYGTLAHGHSLTWLFMILAFVFGRHFVNQNNIVSVVLIGVLLAFGMWTMTAMIYPALTIFIYHLLYILTRYQGSIRKRLNLLGLSFLVFIVLTFVLYLPIISEHGIGQLIDHPSLPDRNWRSFTRVHQDGAFELWLAIADTTGTTIALLGLVAILVSAFISIKYRLIMIALALGAIPMVLIQARVSPPPVWYYTLFLFHLGSGIALFYLLKFIQEKVFKKLGKRMRTTVAGLMLFVILSSIGLGEILRRVERYPEAALAGRYLYEVLEPGDKAYVEYPWDAPVRFHAREHGVPRDRFFGAPGGDSWVFITIAPVEGQTVEKAIRSQQLDREKLDNLRMVKDWSRIEIFAARYQ